MYWAGVGHFFRDYHHHWGKPWTATSVLTRIDQLQYFLVLFVDIFCRIYQDI
jgi:hypothetical protein